MLRIIRTRLQGRRFHHDFMVHLRKNWNHYLIMFLFFTGRALYNQNCACSESPFFRSALGGLIGVVVVWGIVAYLFYTREDLKIKEARQRLLSKSEEE